MFYYGIFWSFYSISKYTEKKKSGVEILIVKVTWDLNMLK